MRLVLIMLVLVIFTSCGQLTSVKEEEEPNFQAYQIPGCVQDLPKNSPTLSSCFTYSFEDTLKVDLCLSSNCCPDSGRFAYSYLLAEDTIKLTVVDIAEHLCDCICNYIVHSDISGLNQDEYIFECIYYDSVYYQQMVVRKK